MLRQLLAFSTIALLGAACSAADISLTSVKYTGSAAGLTITVKASDVAAFAGLQVMIDTDADATSGFAIDDTNKGFELMIEGATLYEHEGVPADWTWNRISDVKRTIDGTTATLTVPKSEIKSDKVKIFTRVLTPDWQKVIATDKAGEIAVSLDKAAAAAPDAKAPASAKPVVAEGGASVDDKAGDATDPATDFTSLSGKQDGSTLRVTLKTKADSKFETVLLFIDTDSSGATGYQPPADPTQGYDVLVQGEDVFKFRGGAERGSWAWEKVGSAKRAVAGDTLTIDVPSKLIGGTDIGLSAWFMTADFQTALDRVPDSGTMPMKLKVTAADSSDAKPVTMSAPRPNKDLSIRDRVAKATSYYCYYGSGKVAELSHYDVAILHAPQMKRDDIAQLNALGVVTVGYLSIGEDDELHDGDGKGPGGKASWYFDKHHNNKPDQNGVWKSWYANCSDPNWRANRVAEAKRLVNEDGYEGIFLDTIDTCEVYTEAHNGEIELIKELREALPDKAIVLNQGFVILPDVAQYADALMLESFTLSYDFDAKSYIRNFPQSMDYHLRRINSVIKPAIAQHPLNIFVLDYAKPDQTADLQDAADRCKTLGLLFAVAPIFLDDVYTDLPTGKIDAKWTQPMASPDSMSFTLAEDRNGFSAGTKFLPSSCFAGYKIDPVVDGIADRTNLSWSKAAWASGEDGDPAVLEIRLARPSAGGHLKIRWWDAGGASRTFKIETQSNGTWATVADVTNNHDVTSLQALPGESFNAIRITQPPGGGSADRPNLMWIGQVWLEQ